MSKTVQELKQMAIAAIDARAADIIALGDSIYAEPELGYKEFKTAKKFTDFLDSLGVAYRDKVALTDVVAPFKGGESRLRLAVMGELDAVVVPAHPNADPVTGAAHSCGHNAMIAGIAGVAAAFADPAITAELGGDVVVMAVPAEEFVELEYRMGLKNEGKITMLGGKQEFIVLGEMDDIDMMIMQHNTSTENEGCPSAVKACAGGIGNGMVGKLIRYIGKEAHAGAAPHDGINALNAAQIGLVAVNAQRETFRDSDHIRVHPIITKGGDLVNVVPADVRLETYVRGSSVEAILDASAKVTRAFLAGGMAVGAETVITDIPGYMPGIPYPALEQVIYNNLVLLLGEEKVAPASHGMGGGSTDAADIQAIMPAVQANVGGAAGGGHGADYRMVDRDLAYLTAAKMLACTAIDLLANGAELGLKVKAESKPPMTKAEYLEKWAKL